MASPARTVQAQLLTQVTPLATLHTFPPIRRISYSRKCVLALVANGYSNQEIKVELEYASEQVVKNMIREIYMRLGISSGKSRNRVLVARWYIEIGQFLPTKDPIPNL